VVVRDPISLGAQAEPRGADATGAIDPCLPRDLAAPDAARTSAAAPPATRFAIETALLDALARSGRVSIAALLAPIVERRELPRVFGARATARPRAVSRAS